MAAGVATAGRSHRAQAFEGWLERGHHGSMAWMERNVQVRVDHRLLLEGARSVLCVADRYPGMPDAPTAPGQGRVARYARGRDYHRHMKKRLHALCDGFSAEHQGQCFRACVDTAPILERDTAAAAGLGAVGKNTMLIQEGVGSWLLLGEIVTTALIEPTGVPPSDPCGTCTRCIDACPTDALTPFALDASKCISALTIEHRGVIDANLHEAMGDWIFGCDICQEVCPHNQPTQRTSDAAVHDAYRGGAPSLELLAVLQWGEADRIQALAGTSATRATLDMWRRNAAIAGRNALCEHSSSSPSEAQAHPSELPSEVLAEALDALAADGREPEMIRQAASPRR
ncbi:MAG: tRNA epoxyqueuosine(34) reductase QueG [Phycisphaerales bacterium]|nr:tRNA epoxyqueuosine(34) reductase QueG [Phycisphaerales bacterium]